MTTPVLDLFLLAIYPYLAFTLFVVGSIQRYREKPFSYSSLSTQFLENQYHFWGMVPFHYGLLVVLGGHLAAFLVPRGVLLWNQEPLRLYLLELTGFSFALLTLVGIINLIVRRLTSSSLKELTTRTDWVLLGLLVFQIGSGIDMAVRLPWGSSWFAGSLAPYLWSLLKLNPDLGFVSPFPFVVKLHIVGAFTFLALFPFSRLVHMLVLPLPYLWRKPQVVRWYKNLRTGTQG